MVCNSSALYLFLLLALFGAYQQPPRDQMQLRCIVKLVEALEGMQVGSRCVVKHRKVNLFCL